MYVIYVYVGSYTGQSALKARCMAGTGVVGSVCQRPTPSLENSYLPDNHPHPTTKAVCYYYECMNRSSRILPYYSMNSY
jgi:hypothetical protein